MKKHQISTPELLLGLSAAAVLVVSSPVKAAEIQVPLDHVRTVILARPAKTIYVGNPTIADITVVDPRHVFVLGNTFGSTNLIALDASGEQTLNDQVVVTDRPGAAVTVERGVFRTTMMCTVEHCEQATA